VVARAAAEKAAVVARAAAVVDALSAE